MLPRGLRLGNCVIGALMLWYWGYGRRMRLVYLNSQIIPHCEVVSDEGLRYHFRVRKGIDSLPPFLQYFLFWGEFECRGRRGG